jgi:hypothetical protein
MGPYTISNLTISNKMISQNLSIESADMLMPFEAVKHEVMQNGSTVEKETKLMKKTQMVIKVECDLVVIMKYDYKLKKQCLRAVNSADKILGTMNRSFHYLSNEMALKSCTTTWATFGTLYVGIENTVYNKFDRWGTKICN